MKRLNIVLLLSILALIIYIISYDKKFKSKFNDDTVIYGVITKYIIYDNKVIFYLESKELLLCEYRGSEFKYELGDYVKVNGILKEPSKNRNFNLFNYSEYLKHEHINYIFDVDNINLIKKNKKILYKIKNSIMRSINKNKNKEYLYAFILGNTKYIDKNVMQSYRDNGISHLFAVSGMHVSLISLVILKVFRKFKFKKLILIIILLFYTFLTDFSPSILRTVLFFILLTINKKFKLNVNNISLMFILLIICIIIDPFIIFKIGFLYSFIISFFLILFFEIIERQQNEIFKLFIISIISFFAALPITINSFYEVNFLSIFLNILFVPFVSIILFPICIFSYLIHINLSFIIEIFENFSLLCSKIDVFIFNFPKLNLVLIIIYYIFLLIILNYIKLKKYRYLFVLLSLLLLFKNINIFNFNTEILFIDVMQGDSALIKFPNNKCNMIIDTGGFFNNHNILDNLILYLKSVGITEINYLVISHGDYDHMGEAINLVNNFKVEKVIFNCGEFDDLEQELIKVLDKKKIKYYSCIKELNIDNNKLYFLQTKEYDNENDNSNVIYTELNGYTFMFMGDASATTEKEILNKYNLSDIDVLKVGHHGSRTSSSKEFINEINPKYSIISVGKNNRYGHPNKEALDNLKDSKIYRTDIDGSIMFKIKNNKLKIETCIP